MHACFPWALAPAPAPPASSNKFGPLEDDDEDDQEEVAPVKAVSKQSVMSAVMPSAPAPAPAVASFQDDDDDAEDVEPVAVPKKATVTKKAIVKKVVGK